MTERMAEFRLIAPRLWQLSLLPLDCLNVYLLGDVLVDSGAFFTRRRLLAALDGCELRAHALTHAHPDHQGASRVICLEYSIPLWCGNGDREAATSGDLAAIQPNPSTVIAGVARWAAGPGHPVARTLHEEDEVAGFKVLETPGHTPGHISFWREDDGVLLVGDVLFHRNPVTLRPGLCEPFVSATQNPEMNRNSARRLAALRPSLICFGHGAPMMEGRGFTEFVARLPS